MSNDSIICFGYNGGGSGGVGHQNNQISPEFTQIPNGSHPVTISKSSQGAGHTCSILANHTIRLPMIGIVEQITLAVIMLIAQGSVVEILSLMTGSLIVI